jgi:hypothetical protein
VQETYQHSLLQELSGDAATALYEALEARGGGSQKAVAAVLRALMGAAVPSARTHARMLHKRRSRGKGVEGVAVRPDAMTAAAAVRAARAWLLRRPAAAVDVRHVGLLLSAARRADSWTAALQLVEDVESGVWQVRLQSASAAALRTRASQPA